jgi:hypothetical protein
MGSKAKQTRDTVIATATGFTIAALLVAAGCPLASPDEHKRLKDSSSDAGSPSALVPQACNTLRALNCAAGNPPGTTCEVVLGKIATDRLTPLADNLVCVIKATTKEAVRGCGPVECP